MTKKEREQAEFLTFLSIYLNKEVPFNHSDKPDFAIQLEGVEIGIEHTSVQDKALTEAYNFLLKEAEKNKTEHHLHTLPFDTINHSPFEKRDLSINLKGRNLGKFATQAQDESPINDIGNYYKYLAERCKKSIDEKSKKAISYAEMGAHWLLLTVPIDEACINLHHEPFERFISKVINNNYCFDKIFILNYEHKKKRHILYEAVSKKFFYEQ